MRDSPPPNQPQVPASWIPLGIFLLLMLFTPLGRLWALAVLVVGVLIWQKRLRLETGLLWAGVAFAGGVLGAAWSPVTLAPNLRDEPSDEQRLPDNFKRLEVKGFNGFIHIIARPGLPRARFDRKGGATVSFEQRGDTVSITARRPFFSFSSGVNVTLEVPENLEITAQTSNGVIELQGHTLKAMLKTSNDRISLRDTGNIDAHLETSNDAISVERIAGTLWAHTSNGSLRVFDSELSLDAQTSNAGITLERVSLKNNTKSRASTSNGNITVTTLDAPSGLLIRGSTSNARVDVTAPGLDVRLEDTRFEARKSGFGTAELDLQTSNDRITLRP